MPLNPTLSEAVAIINDMLADAAINDQHHQMDPALEARGKDFIARCEATAESVFTVDAKLPDVTAVAAPALDGEEPAVTVNVPEYIRLEVTSHADAFPPFARNLSFHNLGIVLGKTLNKMPDALEGLVTEA